MRRTVGLKINPVAYKFEIVIGISISKKNLIVVQSLSCVQLFTT